MKENRLPRFWCTKVIDSEEFKNTVIKYLSGLAEEDKSYYMSSWDYCGVDNYQGRLNVNAASSPSHFCMQGKEIVEITIEEFIELTEQPIISELYPIW